MLTSVVPLVLSSPAPDSVLLPVTLNAPAMLSAPAPASVPPASSTVGAVIVRLVASALVVPLTIFRVPLPVKLDPVLSVRVPLAKLSVLPVTML